MADGFNLRRIVDYDIQSPPCLQHVRNTSPYLLVLGNVTFLDPAFGSMSAHRFRRGLTRFCVSNCDDWRNSAPSKGDSCRGPNAAGTSGDQSDPC